MSDQPPRVLAIADMPSDSSPGEKYRVILWVDDTCSCTCMAWAMGSRKSGEGERFACKHVKRARASLAAGTLKPSNASAAAERERRLAEARSEAARKANATRRERKARAGRPGLAPSSAGGESAPGETAQPATRAESASASAALTAPKPDYLQETFQARQPIELDL